MSKFMKQEDRDQAIKELMVSIRKNTQESKCIDVFEILLNEISDKNVVDTAIVDMCRFIGEFLRLAHDVDNMKNVDFIAKILTYEFIHPEKFFVKSKKLASEYLKVYDIIKDVYHEYSYKGMKEVVLSNKNCLGNISHTIYFEPKDIANLTKKFKISDLSYDEIKEKLELSRKVVLLYNYMPAVVKAFLQTKRRTFNLDKNSKKFA